MKRLLYIGHAYHNKTKSTQFLQDIFSEQYEVEKFDFDPYNDSFEIFKSLNGKRFDVVVIFQIMPSIKELKKYLSFDKINFFPMYDAAGDLDSELWQEYSECNIINFSKTLHKECLKRGFSSYYIQYFPKPIEVNSLGDEKSVFFWQRLNSINIETILKVIDYENINKLYLHNAPDPCHNFVEPPAELNDKTEISTWFEKKEDLLNQIQKAAVYFPPRHFEGIGMSFLEAMAMGRCVIAPNNPTMNEYIVNGVTGYLYDINNPAKISLDNIGQIQNNTKKYIEKGYANWEKNKFVLLDWIKNKPSPNRLKMYFYYNKINFWKILFSMYNEYTLTNKRKVVRFLGLKFSWKLS